MSIFLTASHKLEAALNSQKYHTASKKLRLKHPFEGHINYYSGASINAKHAVLAATITFVISSSARHLALLALCLNFLFCPNTYALTPKTQLNALATYSYILDSEVFIT